MPPRKGARPITQIKRTGEMDVDFVVYENTEFKNIISKADQQYVIDMARAMEATKARRKAEDKNMTHINDFNDAKRYLLRKQDDKLKKIKFYEEKLKNTREKREKLLADLQAKMDQLKQAQDLELTQLNNNLKANKVRRDSLATVAALENQLKREIAEAEQTLKKEKQQQSQQMSTALDDYYKLHKRHLQELHDSVEREKQKNRGMTAENLERTVIEMMKEIDAEKNHLANEVRKAKVTANRNTELMEKNKQLYMNRDLLQSECDELTKKISKNDASIRSLVEELKEHDQQLSSNINEEEEESAQSSKASTPNISAVPSKHDINEQPRTEGPDREKLLNNFFISTVGILTTSIVKILQILDEEHSADYDQFHNVFTDFEGRKKELRFLMSKLGNLTYGGIPSQMLPPMELSNIEGVDEEYTQKNLIAPQNQAILEFAEPIGEDEYPDLIATHFFQ